MYVARAAALQNFMAHQCQFKLVCSSCMETKVTMHNDNGCSDVKA